jgi:hypothetical protein
MRYTVYFLVLILSLCGCHAKSSSSGRNNLPGDAENRRSMPSKPLPKGLVIDSVICSDNSSQIYSIYIPSNYDTTKKWPIIYCFDPHGNGNLPVKLYKDLAEKYGFILAGTYNSKNGMAWENCETASQALMKDTWMRLSLDNNRLYTCGFSGGAMVASMIAISEGGIAGVISCGGGFPQDHSIKQPFTYISLVGEKDFHYVSVKQLDKLLDSTSLTHQFIVFDGKHQWPPQLCLEQAMQWLDMDAMRTKIMPKNDSMIKSIQDRLILEAEDWHKKRNIVQEYYTYKELLNYMRDLADMGKYAAIIQQLENSETLQKYLRDEETLEAEEDQEILEFRAHISRMDETWWENKISIMKKLVYADSTSPEALQTQRMLGYLSLEMYMGSVSELNERNYAASSYFVNLYDMVDPENPEHSYLNACLDMIDHQSDKALDLLNDAVKQGFSDSRRLENDSNFVALHDKPEFKKLLKEIASKPEKLDMTN